MAPIIIVLALLVHPIVALLLGAKWEGTAQWVMYLGLASRPPLPMQTLPSLCVALPEACLRAVASSSCFYLSMVTLGYFWAGIPGVVGAKFLAHAFSAIFSLFLCVHC